MTVSEVFWELIAPNLMFLLLLRSNLNINYFERLVSFVAQQRLGWKVMRFHSLKT